MKRNKTNTLITVKDFDGDFSPFKSEKERIKYISNAYRNMSISEAFAKFYGEDLEEKKDSNTISNVEIGKCYWGNVESISKTGISITLNGVKEEIFCKENFGDCISNIQNYLLNHNNSIYFEVREKRHNVYYVSILNGYYRLWNSLIDKYIKHNTPIDVHIDSLTKGGYLAHTSILPLKELTGKEYTSSVFIPGSNIVLNIERNFERWVGEDVQIVPQKFVKFKQVGNSIENSLIGSRKLVLQALGNKNLYDIYNKELSVQKLSESMNVTYERATFLGTVTGIINSNKKTGIFVELNNKYITGLMPTDTSELLNYKPGDQIEVKIKDFEIQEGKEPFVLNKKNEIIYANVRCIFEQA